MATYRVWSLDVWGHAPSECCAEYECTCVSDDGHDDDTCRCHYDVNDRCSIGHVDIPENATDEDVLAILDTEGFIRADLCVLDVYSDDSAFDVVSSYTHRPLLSLEACEP